MAESGSGQEKTEQPSAKRLQQARERGQVARSRELNTLVMLLLSGFGFLLYGGYIVSGLLDMMRAEFTIDRVKIFEADMLPQYIWDALLESVKYLTPFFILLVIAAIVGPISLGGVVFSTKALAPKLDRLDPVRGLQKVFSWRGIVELLKSLAKFAIVASAGYFLLLAKYDEFIALGNLPITDGLTRMGNELIWLFIILSSTLLIVAMVDVPFQLWDHNRQLKMTRQEVKDENKESDGNPEIKGKQRSKQRDMAFRRMMEAVPDADVVITNPTHFAVALKYDQEKMNAPVVVALGADLIAQQIRRVASANDIPVLQAPLLARALYFNSDLNKEIPAGLYLAIAQVLAYIYQLRQYRVYGGVEPVLSEDFPIPDDLRTQ
jgi:flagellar biosynthetic protein FlhB